MPKQFFPISRGAIALTQGILEKNNCVVRALANCADLDYAYADRLCRDYGRKFRHGMHAKDFIPLFLNMVVQRKWKCLVINGMLPI